MFIQGVTIFTTFQGVEVPFLQLQHFILLVVYEFFFTDCVIRSSSVCLNFFQGRALVENNLEYIRILSDSYSRSHTLPREEPIQVRSPSLYFTLKRDYPEGFAGLGLHCGLGVVNLPKDFGPLDLLMEGNKSALFVIDALVQSKF